jgi:hypothetical protein
VSEDSVSVSPLEWLQSKEVRLYLHEYQGKIYVEQRVYVNHSLLDILIHLTINVLEFPITLPQQMSTLPTFVAVIAKNLPTKFCENFSS